MAENAPVQYGAEELLLVERQPSFAASRADHLVLQRYGDGPSGAAAAAAAAVATILARFAGAATPGSSKAAAAAFASARGLMLT